MERSQANPTVHLVEVLLASVSALWTFSLFTS